MGTLVLDANLLCVLVAGSISPDTVARHKRLSAYDAADFKIIARILSNFTSVVVPPHVLTECSNLIRMANEPLRSQLTLALKALIDRLDEQQLTAQLATQRPEFARLGLTDAVLLAMMETGGTLLTADLDLYLASSHAGHRAINYNHVRDQPPEDLERLLH